MPVGDPVTDYDGLRQHDIALKAWINSDASGIAHTDGNQTLTGITRIANEVAPDPSHPNRKSCVLPISIPGYTKYGPGLVDNVYGTVVFRDDTEYSNFPNGWVGSVEAQVYSDGRPIVSMLCYSQDPDTPNAFAFVRVFYDVDGNAVAIASPTSDTRANRTDIITRGFLLDHYEPKLRFGSTPVYSVTLAEDMEYTEASPLTIQIPEGAKKVLVWTEFLAGSATASPVEIKANYGTSSSVLTRQANALHTTNTAQIIVEFAASDGWVIANKSTNTSAGAVSGNSAMLTGEPVIVSGDPSFTAIDIYATVSGGTAKAGSRVIVYAATEV